MARKKRGVPVPAIGPVTQGVDDFEDSLLLGVEFDQRLENVDVMLAVADETGWWREWVVKCEGVLRFEFETTGTGEKGGNDALGIYSVHRLDDSDDFNRWLGRLETMGCQPRRTNSLFHIVFASSFLRGWGKGSDLEGISVVCRDFSVSRLEK